MERRIDLLRLSSEAEESLKAASTDGDRRKALIALVNAFADPHAFADLPDPQKTGSSSPACPPEPMKRSARTGLRFERLPSFVALDVPAAALFTAGTAQLNDKRTIGIVRFISLVPRHYMLMCSQTAAGLGIAPTEPCDSGCEERLDRAVGRALNAALEDVLRALDAKQPAAIVVDLSDNGGGNDWAEIAARILAGTLRSPEVGLLRHPAWIPGLDGKKREIEAALATATGEWRDRLTRAGEQIAAASDQVRKPCDLTSAWMDPQLGSKPLPCSSIARGFLFSSGPDAHDRPPSEASALTEEVLFTAAQYRPYHEGVTRRPLFVFINRNTYSAAELVAAMLQDNGRAKLLGEVTAGAGCGHATEAGTDFTLPRSGLRVHLPDCVRFRKDGTSERRGITPDMLVPWGPSDSAWQRVDKAMTSLAAALKSH